MEKAGHEPVDLGAHQYDAGDDYPDFAEALGKAVIAGEAERGVLICGSGVGASIAANKLRGENQATALARLYAQPTAINVRARGFPAAAAKGSESRSPRKAFVRQRPLDSLAPPNARIARPMPDDRQENLSIR